MGGYKQTFFAALWQARFYLLWQALMAVLKRPHFKLPLKVWPFKAPAAINNYCIQTMAMSSYKTHTSEKGEREREREREI